MPSTGRRDPGASFAGAAGGLSAGPLPARRRARAHIFRYEGGVLAEPIARSFDLDNNGVVKQAIKQCCGDDGITKNLAPFGEAAVRSEDHRAFFTAGVNQLEEQIAAAG
jgi:hypothetical protein